MIETVSSYQLPVGERLVIYKNRILPPEGNPTVGRISIVSGTHGDELEGQFVCYEVIRIIKENIEYLNGIVDVYPAVNPLGVDSASRLLPKLNLDMNRMFPGNPNGTMLDKVAARIVDDIMGSDVCVDVHASDTLVREMPQVRISGEYESLITDYAKFLNADVIWYTETAASHEATLVNSLNALSLPSMVVEMGLGNRIDRNDGSQIVKGIFNLMYKLGLWKKAPEEEIRRPLVVKDSNMDFYRADHTGIFLPSVKIGTYLHKGDEIGRVIETLSGDVISTFCAHEDGFLFTLREYPMVFEGAMLARVIHCKEDEVEVRQ